MPTSSFPRKHVLTEARAGIHRPAVIPADAHPRHSRKSMSSRKRGRDPPPYHHSRRCPLPSFPRKRESTFTDLIVQISPGRVTLLNQLDLPCPIPFLDRLFPPDSAFHGFMNLVPNQQVDAVTFRESFYPIIPVLPDPLNGIRRDTDIQGAMGFARKDVNAGGFHKGASGFVWVVTLPTHAMRSDPSPLEGTERYTREILPHVPAKAYPHSRARSPRHSCKSVSSRKRGRESRPCDQTLRHSVCQCHAEAHSADPAT